MLTRTRSRASSVLLLTTLLAALGMAAACDKVPLLAPSGTVITLFAAASTVAVDGNVEIIATVIENGTTATTGNGAANGNGTGTTATATVGSGTPVHNGTLVSFTTTIGRIEPSEARTTNGQVKVRFIAGGQSGSATITAYSGGASGRIPELLVGTAAAERLSLTASPQTLGPSGGDAVISARVENITGLGVTGVPVSFTADAGTISASTALTDSNGVATVTLRTTRVSIVTASVAGKTATVTVGLNPRTGIILTPPATAVSAGQVAAFGVAVSATANIRDVTIVWGDGSSDSLGALSGSQTVPHTYAEAGTYTVRATATDVSNFSETVSATITVLPAQPPSVIVTPSNSSPLINENVVIRAQVSGNTSSIVRYDWNFGAGANTPPISTTGNQVAVSWSTPGSKIITVTAVQAQGPTGDGFAPVTVRGTSIVER